MAIALTYLERLSSVLCDGNCDIVDHKVGRMRGSVYWVYFFPLAHGEDWFVV